MNHLKMLQDINNLVDTDFCLDMEHKAILDNQEKFTQDEAIKMAKIIAGVYSVSHCTYCRACGSKYIERMG